MTRMLRATAPAARVVPRRACSRRDRAPREGSLVRPAAWAASIYHISKLLDELQGRTAVTTILFYSGDLSGTTGLWFMNLKGQEALGNFRVKIYG